MLERVVHLWGARADRVYAQARHAELAALLRDTARATGSDTLLALFRSMRTGVICARV
jgi:hypothetical protein